MWVSQIQIPPTKNHSTFMNMLRQPGWDDFHFTFVPNGQIASTPSFMLCNPNGIPTIVIIRISPAMKYSMAICKPPNNIHMMFPNVFILVSLSILYLLDVLQVEILLNLTIVRELILTFLSLYMGCQPQWNSREYLLSLRFLRRWLRYRQWLHLVIW